MIETPPRPLDRLYSLQELLSELKVKRDRRSRTPDHLVHVEAAFQDALRRRAEVATRLASAEKRRRELEGEISEFAEKLKKYQAQLMAVKTNREYSALLNEIDGVKREIRTREDEVLAVEETLGRAKAEAETFDAEFPEEQKAYDEEMMDWRAEQAVLDGEILSAEARLSELREGIDKKLLGTFERIAKSRAGVGLARVAMVTTVSSTNQTAACSACNVRLRPQLLADVRLGRDTVFCESCKRILYWDGGE